MKRSSCLSFMERFQPYLIRSRSAEHVYNFENAELIQHGKPAGQGCDRAILKSDTCQLILVECKNGYLSLSDFNRAIEQLTYSIGIVYRVFEEPPDLAVLCYEKLDPWVSSALRSLKIFRTIREVRFIAEKFAGEFCKAC